MEVKKLKVAILHDTLYEYGGSERVLEELLTIFPKASLYTFYFNTKKSVIYEKFNRYHPRTSLLQKIPLIHLMGKYFSVFKMISWVYFYLLNLSKYDLIISSSHSFNSKFVRSPSQSIHICYLHTPPRYLYGYHNEISVINEFPWKYVVSPVMQFLRIVDKKGARKPNLIVVNSSETQKRVAKHYQRLSQILSPPVKIAKRNRKYNTNNRRYYIFHSRLTNQKGAKLAVQTCTQYQLPLKVVGEGFLSSDLKHIAGPTVEFLGFVSDRKLISIYENAHALLWCAKDEDFGMVPVEAMSHGVPIIAYRSGGIKETIIEGKTGYFFNEYSPRSLFAMINYLKNHPLNSRDCYNQAKQFSCTNFRNRFLYIVSSSFHEKRSHAT